MTNQTITVEATGHSEATPDLATVEAVALGTGDSASIARSGARDRAATIRESVNAVPVDRIATTDLEVKDAEAMFEPATDAAFQAKEHLRVDCTPATAASVVTEVTDAGGRIETVDFSLHEEVRDRLLREALTAAMEQARTKATTAATAEDLAVEAVQDVTITAGDGSWDDLVDEALTHRSDDSLQPTPVRVTQQVEVVYTLTAA